MALHSYTVVLIKCNASRLTWLRPAGSLEKLLLSILYIKSANNFRVAAITILRPSDISQKSDMLHIRKSFEGASNMPDTKERQNVV